MMEIGSVRSISYLDFKSKKYGVADLDSPHITWPVDLHHFDYRGGRELLFFSSGQGQTETPRANGTLKKILPAYLAPRLGGIHGDISHRVQVILSDGRSVLKYQGVHGYLERSTKSSIIGIFSFIIKLFFFLAVLWNIRISMPRGHYYYLV